MERALRRTSPRNVSTPQPDALPCNCHAPGAVAIVGLAREVSRTLMCRVALRRSVARGQHYELATKPPPPPQQQQQQPMWRQYLAGGVYRRVYIRPVRVHPRSTNTLHAHLRVRAEPAVGANDKLGVNVVAKQPRITPIPTWTPEHHHQRARGTRAS
eukprot:COSAG01_NODE_9594_length_2398_cov_1.685515_2_plen_157_part_00